jgi:hypothetical protein
MVIPVQQVFFLQYLLLVVALEPDTRPMEVQEAVAAERGRHQALHLLEAQEIRHLLHQHKEIMVVAQMPQTEVVQAAAEQVR